MTSDDAVRELRARGIDQPEELLEYGSPDQLIAACHRWDAVRRERRVGTGLLVTWIRGGEFPTEPSPRPISKAEAYAVNWDGEVVKRYPIGASVEWHSTVTARGYRGGLAEALEKGEDICDGEMIVTSNTFPAFAMQCDRCGWEAGHTPTSLHTIDRDRAKAVDA